MSTATDEPLDADLCSYDFTPGSHALVCTVHAPGLCPLPDVTAERDWDATFGDREDEP